MANRNPSPKTRFKSGKIAETNGQKGGSVSGQKKHILTTFKDVFSTSITDEDRRIMVQALISEAKSGNIRAFEMLRDTIGQRPVYREEVYAKREWRIEDLIQAIDAHEEDTRHVKY